MNKDVVILVRQEGLGVVEQQEREFGLEMFERFLHTLESQPRKPSAICFYTAGVKLVCDGSPVIPALRLIEGMGVRLLSCRSCLEYYGLKDRLLVGETGGMNDILRLLLEADHVVTV